MQKRYRLKTFFMSNFGVGVTALIVFAVIFGIARARQPKGEGGATPVSAVPSYSPSPTATGPPTVPSAMDKSTASTVPVATPTLTPVNTPTPSPTDTRIPPSPSPTDTPLLNPIARLTVVAYLYRGPGANYPVVDKAAAGTTFPISGKNAAGDWWQIEIAIGPVWIYAPFVQVDGPIDSIGVVTATTLPRSLFPTITPIPAPADAQTPLVPSPTVTQLSYPVARLTADMNLRSGPGIDFPIVGAAVAGSTFRITGKHPTGEWWQIEAAAGPAWVYALFVQVEGPIESLGVTAVLPPPPLPVSTSTPFPTPSSRCPGDCAEAHERGLSNMTQDHLCYHPELDSDGNGIACERCPLDCFDAHEIGLSNLTPDHPCFRSELDYDGNGIACERNR